MKKILLFGCFGQGNFGDELMLKNFIDNCSDENNNFYIISNGNLDVNLSRKNFRILNISRIKHKYLYLKMWILYADYCFWVGGTCFTDQEGDGNFELFKFANTFKKKYGYIGVGVNKISSIDRIEKFKFLLLHASIITVRDVDSQKEISNITKNKVSCVVADDLATLEKLSKVGRKNQVLFAWRNLNNYYDKSIEETALNEVARFLSKISTNYEKIVLLAVDNTCDADCMKIIRDKLILDYSVTRIDLHICENIQSKIKYICESAIVITARLHPAVIAELSGIPTIALSYSDKIDYFMNSINKASRVIHIDEISYEKLMRIYNETEIAIPEDVVLTKKTKAKKNIDELLLFLGRG